MKSRALVLVGTVLYVVAWFVPVFRPLFGGVHFGWETFTAALWPYEPPDPWYGYVSVVFASAVSNFFLVGALVLVFVARRRPPRFLRAILIACAVLDTHYFVLPFRGLLRIGYYLWASSFLFIATGLLLEARGGGSSKSPAV